MKHRARVIIVVAATLLGACSTTEYTFTPPDTPEGRACVNSCQLNQMSCRRQQDSTADYVRGQCESLAERREAKCEAEATVEYIACLKFAKTDEERNACQKKDCEQPACTNSPNYSSCDSDYRVCFQSCGGKIGVIEH